MKKGWILPAAIFGFFVGDGGPYSKVKSDTTAQDQASWPNGQPVKLTTERTTQLELGTNNMNLDLPIVADPIIAKVGDLTDAGGITITSIKDNPMISGLPTTLFPPPNLQLMAVDIQRTRDMAAETAYGENAAIWQRDIDWAKYAISYIDSTNQYPAPITLSAWREGQRP